MSSLPKKPAELGPVLMDSDRASPTWTKLREHYEKRLATLRAQNDNEQPAEETAKLRGRIAEVKRLLAMDKDTPQIEFKATE
jgi:hypothetical protein